jgi:hypothetical protein
MDEQHQNEAKGKLKGNLKRIFGPPLIVISCWSIFTYGGVLQFLNPRWDYITGFSFGALAFGFLVLPFVVLSLGIGWWRAPSGEKGVACSYFVGWALAWGILVFGFMTVPWSKGWP